MNLLSRKGEKPRKRAGRGGVRVLFLPLVLLLPLAAARPQENTAADAERFYKQVVELRQQGRFAEALPLASRLAEIVKLLAGESHPAYATSLNDLGEIHRSLGQYAEAEPFYRKCLAIYESTLGPDHSYTGICLNNLALLYLAQARYAEAEALSQRALAVLEKALGPDHPFVATALTGLADIYLAQGLYAQAEPLYRRSLAIREKALGPDHPDVANGLNNIATLYSFQARYAEAEPLLRRSLAILEKVPGPDNPAAAHGLSNLAELCRSQGRLAEAEQYCRRSLAIREKALGPDHPDVALNLNNLAQLLIDQGKPNEAEPLLRRGLAIREKALGPGHPAVGLSLNNLAELLIDQRKLDEAEPLLRRGLAIQEKALGPDHVEVGNSSNNLAALLVAKGKPGEAEPLYARSLAIFEKRYGSDHPSVATCLSNLAIFHYSRGEVLEAESFFERELQNVSRRLEYGSTYMSEEDRRQFLGTVTYSFPVYFSFCLDTRRRLPELAGKMYDVLLWEKGFVANSVAALRAKIRAGGDPEALRMFDGLAEKRNVLAKLLAAPADPDQRQRDIRRAQVEGLEREANELEKGLVAQSAELGENRRLARASWRQVRDALKPGEAAVEVVRFPYFDGKRWPGTSYYVALVLIPGSPGPAFVTLGAQEDLERLPLADYRRLVASPEEEAGRPRGLGRKFYSAFWQPIEAELGGAKRVYLSPDGELTQVSLGVVPGADARLLMETCDLRLINSTKDLLRSETPPAPGAAVLVGNPKFELSEAGQRAALGSRAGEVPPGAGSPAPARQGGFSPVSRDLHGGALTELLGTQLEIEDVSEVLKRQGWTVSAYYGVDALEERVKGVRRPRLLHLATHGFFEADQTLGPVERGRWIGERRTSVFEDPMLRSGLYLAGANRVLKGGAAQPDLDDGVLTAYEASQLNLQGTELVVLSACETGKGTTEVGEGVFGLRRALQVAGAESVLMSMWAVPDEETRELMTLFYGKWLSGREKHEALREAQLEMREKVKARYGADLPVFWGAFVLVGR